MRRSSVRFRQAALLAPAVALERGLLTAALIGYVTALVLGLVAVTVVDGEAGEWFSRIGFALAPAATGVLIAAIKRRRD